MSVIRIAEAIQPAAWARSTGLASLRFGQPVRTISESLRTTVDVVGFLLNPAALTALVLAVWRLGQDLDWTGNFFIQQGLFSHWQVWLAVAVALKGAVTGLRHALAALPEPAIVVQASTIPHNQINAI